MNGGSKPIRAIEIAKHTGVVWTATFPYPGEDFFLKSFQWRVYDVTARNIDFQAVGLHKLGGKKKPLLLIRFHDRSEPPLKEGARLTIDLVSPIP
jgi:hypothetical protein